MSTKPDLPSGKGEAYKGEIGPGQKFAKPYEAVDGGIKGMDSTKSDIGEMSGFQSNTDSYIVKKGMVYGEAAKLNIMPPGMDISDQPYADIRNMPMRTLVDISYPGDGWQGARDLTENVGSKGTLA